MLLFFYHICMKELSSKISANASKLGYHDAFINYGCDALVDIMVVISTQASWTVSSTQQDLILVREFHQQHKHITEVQFSYSN